MKEYFYCAECKPADMPCQISKECKRQRRQKRLEKQINSKEVLSDVADKLLSKGILK